VGMDINTARFLISAYEDGVRFGKTLTTGKQTLTVQPGEMAQLQETLVKAGRQPDPDMASMGEAEPVLLALGAEQVVAMDKSDFEGATLLHDLNQPIAPQHRESFDLVYDGGTLEHIFNFPTALQNLMELVKVGGHLVIQNPTNNWSGHGFYQFSPELYFRVLCEENGFKISRMVVFEWGVNRWYEVSDPAEIQSRVYVNSTRRTSLLVLAQRVAVKPINQTTPQQSDYAMLKWGSETAITPAMAAKTGQQLAATAKATQTQSKGTLKTWLKQNVPTPMLNFANFIVLLPVFFRQTMNPQQRNFFLKNPQYFTPVDR
jgi:hypothetical protein